MNTPMLAVTFADPIAALSLLAIALVGTNCVALVLLAFELGNKDRLIRRLLRQVERRRALDRADSGPEEHITR